VSLPPASGNRAVRLPPALPILLALILATLALWPSPASLWNYWGDILDYQHGFLVAAIALAWIGRELWRGGAAGTQPSWKATLALAVVLSGWIIAVRGGIAILHQLLWPLALGLSVWSVAGWPAARRLLPPIGLLYAAIPVWDYGLPVLQRLSIYSTEHILALLGVPASVSEYRVTIPEGTFAIVEGCSGKRYFVVTLAIAYLAIAINGLRGARALLYLAAAGLLSMLVNWIRIVIVIYAGHVSNMQHYLVANEHKSLGNVLFVVLIVGVLLQGRWLARRGATSVSAASISGIANPALAPWQPLMLLPAALLVLALPASLVRKASAPMRLEAMPIATGDWLGPLPPQAGWRPEFSAADDEQRVAYVSTTGTVELYANLYVDQASGRELIHYSNNIINCSCALAAILGAVRRTRSSQRPHLADPADAGSGPANLAADQGLSHRGPPIRLRADRQAGLRMVLPVWRGALGRTRGRERLRCQKL
jgi:exosortase